MREMRVTMRCFEYLHSQLTVIQLVVFLIINFLQFGATAIPAEGPTNSQDDRSLLLIDMETASETPRLREIREIEVGGCKIYTEY